MDLRFIPQTSFTWRVLYRISKVFVTRKVVARDSGGRPREAIAAAIVNDGIGPRASVWGRDHALEMLTYAVPVSVCIVYVPVLAGALLARPVFGAHATGNALALISSVLFPVLGLALPLSLRFALARRQLRAWETKGMPTGEHPVDGSLPRRTDFVGGLMIGALVSAALILGVLTD